MDLNKELRALGYTQTDFAKLIGKHKQQVHRWCSGKIKMNAKTEKMLIDKIKELVLIERMKPNRKMISKAAMYKKLEEVK